MPLTGSVYAKEKENMQEENLLVKVDPEVVERNQKVLTIEHIINEIKYGRIGFSKVDHLVIIHPSAEVRSHFREFLEDWRITAPYMIKMTVSGFANRRDCIIERGDNIYYLDHLIKKEYFNHGINSFYTHTPKGTKAYNILWIDLASCERAERTNFHSFTRLNFTKVFGE